MPNHLTIRYDGNLAVSGYGTLRLGDTNLSSIIAHAFAQGNRRRRVHQYQTQG